MHRLHLTQKYNLPALREEYFSGNDLEVRVWFAADKMDGFILNRINGEWSAMAIKKINCGSFSYYRSCTKTVKQERNSLCFFGVCSVISVSRFF